MNTIQNQQNQKIRKCLTHQSCEIEYILVKNTNNQQIDQLGLCYKCIPTLKIHGCNLILCEDLIKESDKEILQHWPPLNEANLIKVFEKGYKSKTQENAYDTITKFFDDIQNEFVQNMQNIKKTILSTIDQKFLKKEVVLQKYDEITQKEKLQSLIQDYYYQYNPKDEELKQFINDFNKNSKENTQKITNLLKECNFDEFPNLNLLDILKDMINILIQLINQSLTKLDDTIFQNLEQLEQKLFQLISSFKQNINEENNEEFLQISKQTLQSKKQIVDFFNIKNIFEKNQNKNFNNQKLTEIKQNYQQIQSQMGSILQINRNLMNLSSFICLENFIKTNLTEDGFWKITNKQPYQEISFYCQQPILSYAKYTINIEFTPFQNNQNNYSISLGVFNNQLKKWYQFSNSHGTIQQEAEKGSIFNDSSIRFSLNMRKLELQIILKNKYFRLTDYPLNQNIIIAKQNSLDYQLNDLANYFLCFKLDKVQFMNVVNFKQEITLDEFKIL
ncbi:hypothetical protein ABPG72_007327 [Tetrahymena utriculariae]